MPLTLYYIEASPPARSVDLVIHALGLSTEYKPLNPYHQANLTPEFLKLNPLHTIPLIDDDGFTLWESRAIMTYLVSKYGKDDALYPNDLQRRAIVDQRLHYSNDVFHVVREITKALVYFDMPLTTEQIASVKEAQENMEKLLMEGHQFIAGDSLTLADFSYITLVDVMEVYSPSGNQLPVTNAWVDRCKSTMKDFDKVNQSGTNRLMTILQHKLSA